MHTRFPRMKWVGLGIGILILAAVYYAFIYEPPYHGLITKGNNVLVFGHRGFGKYAPDNSLIGAQMAVQHSLDGVDMDAQYSADKQVVIFHDVSLERFTSGTGRVDSKTLQQLQAYDLGPKFGNGFSDVHIATFEDFVKTITPDAYLMVELKVSSIKNTGIEQKVADTIKKYNAYDRVLISSFNLIVLYRLKHIDPKIRTVFIFQDTGWDPARVAATTPEDRVTLPWFLRTEFTRVLIRKIIQPDALSINYNVDPKVIAKLQKVGYPIFLWPVDDASSITAALAKHPYGLSSDDPVLAKRLRDAAASSTSDH